MTASILSLGMAPDRAIVVAAERGGDWSVWVHGDRDVANVPRTSHQRWATRQSATQAAFAVHGRCGIPVIELRDGIMQPLHISQDLALHRGPVRYTLDQLLGIGPRGSAA